MINTVLYVKRTYHGPILLDVCSSTLRTVFLRVLNWRTKIELKITYFACNKGGSKFILACPVTDMPLSGHGAVGGWVVWIFDQIG